MFLKERSRGELVEVLDTNDLVNPFADELLGRYNHGEEAQDPEKFKKSDLSFLSGEALPQCWVNSHYRDNEIRR
jgi:hypothetical protein